ncbi:MAG: DUF47 family protein [Leptospirales bacterium]|nr:DUF47 family protein [Leptospirales bacterium]
MAINNIFSFLLPKESKFFPLISEVGAIIGKASKLMVEFINSDRENMEELYAKIKSCEKEADKLTDTIFRELNNTFITPFDREDIQLLCETLDDVIDSINSSSKRVLIFQPKHIPAEFVKMCEIISASCDVIKLSVEELKTVKRNADKMLGYCERLHEFEHDADDLYEEYIRQLFEAEHDGIEILKLKEIIQDLERTTDIAHYVGKIIKTIIVKYA